MPTSDDFRPMVLQVLLDGETRVRQELNSLVSNYAGLTPEKRSERLPSGQSRSLNRIGWAITSLATAGAVERPARGLYRITEVGRQLAAKWGDRPFREADLAGLPMWDAYQAKLEERRASRDEVRDSSASVSDDQDPMETIQDNVEKINDVVATELLARLQDSTPEFFEKAVLDLLTAMGYGGKERRMVHTGRSGDGGIDGIIPQDPLGVQNVYIQAKRYADTNSVGRPDVQGFLGAITGRGVDRGVFITTSSFTSDARTFAEREIHGKIVLVDGQLLTKLMLQYGVGVQSRQVIRIPEIDEDFFEE
ncbi:restriction endonuclease [Bowdeniella nasicola]|uniref:restriction endonuclease n=1 Tax=Bowdeniella nasicola TaxID=208480 RepID=UPI000A67DD29|nr:restriction endonuclease [Bowdeniella nasicola]